MLGGREGAGWYVLFEPDDVSAAAGSERRWRKGRWSGGPATVALNLVEEAEVADEAELVRERGREEARKAENSERGAKDSMELCETPDLVGSYGRVEGH